MLLGVTSTDVTDGNLVTHPQCLLYVRLHATHRHFATSFQSLFVQNGDAEKLLHTVTEIFQEPWSNLSRRTE